MAKNEERIIENAESIVRTTETVGKLRNSIAKIEQEIISERRGLERRVERAVEDAMQKDGRQQRGTGTTMRDADERQHDGFELARKSLRIWPIIWKEDQRIMVAEVVNFARGALLVESLDNSWIESVGRAPSTKGGHAHNEVVVVFTDKNKRDEAFAMRKNLSTYVDLDGKPTSGVRIQVPHYLTPTFKMLEAYGHDLKRKHGKEFRWYIKFDDFERTLFLQIKIPNIGEWIDISPEEARKSRRRRNDRRIASARELLSPEAENVAPRRTQSVGDMESMEDDLSTPTNFQGLRQTWKPPPRV